MTHPRAPLAQVERGAALASGDASVDRGPPLAPVVCGPSLADLSDLGAECPHLLHDAYDEWTRTFDATPSRRPKDGAVLFDRLRLVDRASLDLPLHKAPNLTTVWRLATLRVSDARFQDLATRVLAGRPVRVPTPDDLRRLAGAQSARDTEDPRPQHIPSLKPLETALEHLADAKLVAKAFPTALPTNCSIDDLKLLYDAGAAFCHRALHHELINANNCPECQRPKTHVKKAKCADCAAKHQQGTPPRRAAARKAFAQY